MSRKQFQIHLKPQKCIHNDFELQRMLKKNIKTLKCLEYEGIPPDETLANAYISEHPRLSSLAKLLKKNKSLSSFKLLICNYRPSNFQRIFPALKNLQSLSTLNLSFSESESFTLKISRSFTLCTKNLKCLTNLNCELYNSAIDPSKRIQTLKFMTPLNVLSQLSLNLSFTNWLTDKSWSVFSHNLPFLTSLTSLSIALNFSKGFTQKGFRDLFSSFNKLDLLTAFSLEVMGSEVLDNPTFICLFESLKDLIHFQDLTLHLAGCQHLKSDGKDPLAVGLALLNPSFFRKLSLEFYSNFCDSDLSELLLVIQRFTLLTHLLLRFAQYGQVTTNGLINLPKILSQLPSLTHLHLAISPTIDSGGFFEVISPSLRDMKDLISIDIMGWTTKEVKNPAVLDFCSQLSDLSHLQYLDLSLNVGSDFGEKCIENLSQALLNLTDLRSFRLYFEGDTKMDEKIFERLLLSFGHLKCLRELKLFFWSCLGLDQGTLEALITSLKSLTCLEKVEFDFSKPLKEKNIEENYEDLIRALENLETLTEIYLKLPQSNKYSEELLQRVGNGTKYFCIRWV